MYQRTSLGTFSTSIHSILHEQLDVKKICSHWIPHNLTKAKKMVRVDWCKEMLEKYDGGASKDVNEIVTGDESWICALEPETKQQSTVRVFEPQPNPTRVVCGNITSKQMVACFFYITGFVTIASLELRRTVNSEWYTAISLPKVFGEIREMNKRRRIIAHHGNASSHTSAQSNALLTGQNDELMAYPPYSPDLASKDCFLFQHIKKNAWSTIFVTRRYYQSVQKPCFVGVSIEVEKQAQIMLVYQNILSTIMLKNVNLFNGKLGFHLATADIC